MGRKSLEQINKERKALGLPFRKRKKTLYKKKVKSNAILPETKKKTSVPTPLLAKLVTKLFKSPENAIDADVLSLDAAAFAPWTPMK